MSLRAICVAESSGKMVFRVRSVENEFQTDLQVVLCVESNAAVRLACRSTDLKILSKRYQTKDEIV